jgi:hypothetical protein
MFAFAAAVLLLGGGTVAFTLLRQTDPRWKDKLLGFSKSATIGGQGCLLTAMTMMHNAAYGSGLTPAAANNLIVQAKGFLAGSADIIHSTAAKALRFITDEKKVLKGASHSSLAAFAAAALAQKGFAIVHVTHDADAAGDHFIVVTKKLPNGFEALDPGFGTGKVTLDNLLQGKSGSKFFQPVGVRQYFRA